MSFDRSVFLGCGLLADVGGGERTMILTYLLESSKFCLVFYMTIIRMDL